MACVALGGETVTGNPGHLGVFIIARPWGEGNREGAFHFKTWPYGGGVGLGAASWHPLLSRLGPIPPTLPLTDLSVSPPSPITAQAPMPTEGCTSLTEIQLAHCTVPAAQARASPATSPSC